MEIAVLASGVGGAVLRNALSEHLSHCQECLEAVAGAVEALRRQHELATAPAPDLTPDLESALEPLREAYREAVAQSRLRPPQLVIRLKRLLEDAQDAALGAWSSVTSSQHPMPELLAADISPTPKQEHLPAMISEDGRTIVRFRRIGSGETFRAYVISQQGVLGESIILSFPTRGKAFPVSPDGAVDLPGISLEDLTRGHIEIRLQPLE